MDNCIPTKVVKIRPKDKPGYTNQVRKLYKECHRLHKIKQRTRNPLDIQKYRDKRREAKNTFAEAKRDYYTNLSHKIMDPNTTSKSYWKLVKSVYGNKQHVSIPPLLENGVLINSDTEKANLLNAYFTSQTIPPDSNMPLPDFEFLTNARLNNIVITPSLVKRVLSNLDPSKASGPDEISNRVLKLCADSLCNPLSVIFNKSLELGLFPDQWKEALVTAIFKKADRQLKVNYRPISLLCCLSKVFERLVFNDLYEYLTTNGLLASCNSGFRKNDSTINRLLALLDTIHKGLEDRKDAILILLDISKAFDKVWHPGLMFKLKQLGITGNLYSWINSYLSNRSQKVVIGGKTSTSLPTHAGVPQGSILGPLLFLVFINDMSSHIELECHQFADDTTFIYITKTPSAAPAIITNQLCTLTRWSKQWRVTFNASKTHFMYITYKHNRPQIDPIYLDNTVISEVTSHTNLGLLIKNNLSWKDHVNSLVEKAQRRLNILARYKYTLPRAVKERLYITMVRPILEYGDVIYDAAPLSTVNLVERVQRRAALICTGAYRHTETQALLRELSWQPLSTRRHTHKLTLFYKIYHHIYPNYLYNLIPPRQETHYNLRRRNELRLPHNRLQSTNNSFFPSTAKVWNVLSPPIKNSTTVNIFKSKIQPNPPKVNPYHRLCSGKEGAWLCRIRLGLSGLNFHRFTYHLIEDPYCQNCTNTLETTEHFLFYCPVYNLARQQFYNSLTDIGVDVNNKPILLQAILHGNNFQSIASTLLQHTLTFLKQTNRFK